jgi:hypothetical protein
MAATCTGKSFFIGFLVHNITTIGSHYADRSKKVFSHLILTGLSDPVDGRWRSRGGEDWGLRAEG